VLHRSTASASKIEEIRRFLVAARTARAAITYSILATCDLVRVSPVHYLADVLPTLARGVFTHAELAELTPAAWKKARAPAEVATSPPV